MALVTRCPNCTLVFKVTPQHLQMQEGIVRCGQCLQIFNGYADLATLQEKDVNKLLDLPISSEEVKEVIQKETLSEDTSDSIKTEEFRPYTFDAINSPRPSRIWGFINIFLLLILVGQVAYLSRTELSISIPSIRPYLTQYCKILNCKIPIPQQINLLSIESTDMQKGKTQQQGNATLVAIIRNQAAFPQQLPSLELTLTDIRDRALASRVFTPDEYFKENSNSSYIIEANTEIKVALVIDSGDLNAVGYRLILLYQ
ncbi:MAG: hypothetical protein CMH70_08460 [Nitrosomonadaceae bacterium]|nr:hypothetical protein [Nitrosomonadaceae bacterium]|tara:strand:- start:716 stop:1486 length:771 start_codon:yes stop_codon:yes gene_type:complete